MLTASQDIDNFIEGQRSRINQPSNQQQPPPPPNNSGNQMDVRAAQSLGETSPRVQTQQFHSSSAVAPFASSSFMEQPDDQLGLNDDTSKSYFGFFDRFGTHDQVRARLNNDLKREYNEYLQSLQNMAKRKVTSQMATPRGNTTQRVQFQQDQIFTSPQQQQQQSDRRTIHNAHSMNDISSSRTVHNTQSMNDLSSGRSVHNVQSMNDLSTVAITELAANRARARLVQQESEQYIRDREAYILELYEQIYELESRIRNLEKESRKLTVTNSSSTTRAQYAEDLTALNTLLSERLNQRIAVDHELTEILNRPPVTVSTRRVVVNAVPTMNIPVGPIGPVGPVYESSTARTEQKTNHRYQRDFGVPMREEQKKKVTEHQQQFQSPRTQQQNSGRPSSPNHARGSIYNGIFGAYKTEEQVIRQERYRQDLLQQIEEKRLRDAAELARRRAAEERERANETERQRLLDRQLAEEALRKQQREEEERRQQQLLEEEAERLRRLEELERQRREEELERQRRQEELDRQRREDELERQRRLEELERQKKEDELDRQKRVDEAERKRRQEEVERRRKQEELDRQRRKEEEEERRRKEELERQRREELERRRREESELERQRRKVEEEEERRRREEEERRRREEEERRRREEEERRRREEEEEEELERRRREEEEEERRRNAKVVRSDSSLSLHRDGTDSDVMRRLLQLKRQLKDKENRLKDTITTDTTRHTHIVDYSSPPYLPPPQPFYLEHRECSDDLLEVARIHYRDAPLTHDILLSVLQTADGEDLHPGYVRDDSVIMRGIGDGKRFTSAEYLTLPKRIDVADDLFATNLGIAASRRRFGASLPTYQDDDPLNTANRELNRITNKSAHRLIRLRHIEGDASEFDSEELLEHFQEKSQLEKRANQTTPHDDAWLK